MANKNEQNNNELVIILGKKSYENNNPTKILFEKSGEGNKSKPKNRPRSIDNIAIFELILVE